MPTWEEDLKARNLARELAERAKVKDGITAESRKCGNCENAVKPNDHYCWNCSQSLTGAWFKECRICKRLFKTEKPKERDTCNRCEGDVRRGNNTPGLFRY
jgi:hypothetical protein